MPGTGQVAQNGTSMAAPHVAGAWALVKQAQPTIGEAEALALPRDNGVSMNDTRTGGTATDLRRLQLGFPSGRAFTLPVARSGTGTVTSTPIGTSCGGTCTRSYEGGGNVTLIATPAAGWRGACSGSEACSVSMDGAKAVSAGFVTP